MMTWVGKIGAYKVTKDPVGSGGTITTTPNACLHTTEGSTLSGARGTIRSTGFAPHFTVGDNAIVQQRPLNETGAALRDHNDHFIQIEAVGFAGSDLKLHKLTPPTFEPLVALAGFLLDEVGIPLRRPPQWSDQLSGTVANNNSRRQSGLALTTRGWFGHVDVPDQSPSWHYDPGSFEYAAMFAAVQGGDDDVNLEQYDDGMRAYLDARKKHATDPGPVKDGKPQWFSKGWTRARQIANAKD